MSFVGQNIRRVDGDEKVTGTAIYTGDLKLPGMIHGKVLRSPLPHARIRSIDYRSAESVPGVLAVLTRENLPVVNAYLGTYVKDQPIVATDKVRYVGDIVAAVAATEESSAEAALKLIQVDYEEYPSLMTVDEALKERAPLIHENLLRGKEPRYGNGATYVHHNHSNIGHIFATREAT